VSLCGSYRNNCINECRLTWLLSNRRQFSCAWTSTSTSRNNTSKSKKVNGRPLLTPRRDLPGNRLRVLWPITTPIRKAMRSITFGILSTFVLKIKRRKRRLSPGVIRNWMLGTPQLISSIRRRAHTFVYFLPGDLVPMESTVSIIIEFLPWINASWLTSPKMYLEELVLALFAKTWKELDLLLNNRAQFMSVITNFQVLKTELPKCTKYCSDISPFGVILRT